MTIGPFVVFSRTLNSAGAGVFIDANSGELRDHWLLSKSPPGTIITRWLVALHMGTFLGLPMKILIFLSGIITTALCVTGVIIWCAALADGGEDGSVEVDLGTEVVAVDEDFQVLGEKGPWVGSLK